MTARDGVEPSGGATESGDAAETAGQALFNPFGTIGVVTVQSPAFIAPPPAEADWTLPVAAAVVGFAAVGWLMRAMIQ